MAEIKKEEVQRLAAQKLGLSDLLKLVYHKSQPYRLGFLLGFLAVSLTLVLLLTGQKSSRLEFSTRPQERTEVEGANVSNVASPSNQVLRTGAAPTTPYPKSASPKSQGKVNLNTASAAQLESLPAIGPVTAGSIIEYRNLHGPFKSVDQLDNVKGIGPKTLEKLRPFVTVE